MKGLRLLAILALATVLAGCVRTVEVAPGAYIVEAPNRGVVYHAPPPFLWASPYWTSHRFYADYWRFPHYGGGRYGRLGPLYGPHYHRNPFYRYAYPWYGWQPGWTGVYPHPWVVAYGPGFRSWVYTPPFGDVDGEGPLLPNPGGPLPTVDQELQPIGSGLPVSGRWRDAFVSPTNGLSPVASSGGLSTGRLSTPMERVVVRVPGGDDRDVMIIRSAGVTKPSMNETGLYTGDNRAGARTIPGLSSGYATGVRSGAKWGAARPTTPTGSAAGQVYRPPQASPRGTIQRPRSSAPSRSVSAPRASSRASSGPVRQASPRRASATRSTSSRRSSVSSIKPEPDDR